MDDIRIRRCGDRNGIRRRLAAIGVSKTGRYSAGKLPGNTIGLLLRVRFRKVSQAAPIQWLSHVDSERYFEPE